jgi:arsenical pump membrane protein
MAVVAWRARSIPLKVSKGVSWSVLPLVAGLFVVVEALPNAGLLRLGLTGLRDLRRVLPGLPKEQQLSWHAFLSNGMNNLPVGLMSGSAIRHVQETSVVAHAILMGVDLGPNLSVTGSLGTILWLIALRREKVVITAWEFFKIGIIAMPVALIASLLVLWN